MRLSPVPLLLGASVLAAACTKTEEPKKVYADLLNGKDCDPLVPTQCGYPFPSSVYLVDDPTTVTGKRVQFKPNATPIFDGDFVDPEPWSHSDGFSPGNALLTHLPGATATGLPSPINIELSVTTASPTILLEVNKDGSVRLVPHWSELDKSTNAELEDQTFIIRPAERLKDATRYIAAIRHVKDSSGAELAPTLVFKALRDGTAAPNNDPTVESRRDLYADIFEKLSKAGIAKNDLQLSWDYMTASRENNTRDLLAMRDDALKVVGEKGPQFKDVTVTENPNQFIARRVEGKFQVPLYLTEAKPGARINRGEDGLPKQNGFAWYDFLVQIPKSVADSGEAAPILQQGHGLLGSRFEGRNGYFGRLANEGGYVTIAVDLVGFAEEDEQTAKDAITSDVGNFIKFIDPQHQGFINEIVAMRLMMGDFRNDDSMKINGKSVVDPSRRYYRGDSQGGIMGATYMAISTDVTRGYLGEPGMPYNLLLNRSRDFDPFWLVLTNAYLGPRQPQYVVGLLQMLWDRTEPNGYAPYITHDMLPNTPKHSVLLNVGIGDFQVSPYGAHIMARAVGAKLLQPSPRKVFGLTEAAGPLADGESAMTEFDFQLDKNVDFSAPIENVPPTMTGSGNRETVNGKEIDVECDPHDKVREQAAVFMQTIEFFKTGTIKNFCSGQNLRPDGAEKPGSCAFDWSIPYKPSETPMACTPG